MLTRMRTRADHIHLATQFIVGCLAVIFNITLLVAVKFKTPAKMRGYSIFIMTTALIDMVQAVSGMLTCTRVLYGPLDATILVFLGPCSAATLPKLETLGAAIIIAYTAGSSPLFLMLIFLTRRQLMRKLTNSISKDRVHHNNIAKTLTYQSLLPLGSLLSVSYWSLARSLPFSAEIPQRLMIMAMTFICFASPIINLLYLPPYRRLFSCSSNVIVISRNGSKDAQGQFNDNCWPESPQSDL
ncbi:hypothetical protein PRIPAC_96223 [Pristionchus pacificus]|uniref:G protein-coupled receptor n=2 Tax=Pristionchus pacificus TaxID=54126 RepID=A0A2A6D1U4_PRIPA|nr:hypothetical protein PRIPAC_96223 [Pristionchus pacificus]|eukprot:PDM84385.1 G protein-coupled receptor [Pristionchus pacificus]